MAGYTGSSERIKENVIAKKSEIPSLRPEYA